MKTQSIEAYVKLGTGLRYLIDLVTGDKIHGPGFVLENIDGLLEALTDLQFPVSSRAALGIRNLRTRLAAMPENATLSRELREEVYKTVDEIYPTVRAEAGGLVAFILTEKRLDVTKLMSNVSALFGAGVFDTLPDLTRFDLSEAAKCIAFERPTAAAFHALRATEGLVRELHATFLPGQDQKDVWGLLIERLRKVPALPRPLLDNLDNIRHSYRNPTQHPEKVYDMDEAQDLFGLCTDVVNGTSKLIAARPLV